MHNGCDIANQMFSNGQLWTWPLIFEICWTRLLSLVVYIWSYLWFSFQVCSTQAVYSFTKWTAWGLAPTEDNRTPVTGRLKRPEHCELMNTYRSWWRHKTVDLQELQILLKEGGGIKTHFSDIYLKYFMWYIPLVLRRGGLKLILAIYTLSILCEIPIRWIQHITGH